MKPEYHRGINDTNAEIKCFQAEVKKIYIRNNFPRVIVFWLKCRWDQHFSEDSDTKCLTARIHCAEKGSLSWDTLLVCKSHVNPGTIRPIDLDSCKRGSLHCQFTDTVCGCACQCLLELLCPGCREKESWAEQSYELNPQSQICRARFRIAEALSNLNNHYMHGFSCVLQWDFCKDSRNSTSTGISNTTIYGNFPFDFPNFQPGFCGCQTTKAA